MSKAIMAACIKEAAYLLSWGQLLNDALKDKHRIQPIATIAAALYAERMTEDRTQELTRWAEILFRP